MRVTAETKEATRRTILEASSELFRTKGFDATTTRDVAVAAKIATGTLFNYFSTKESIATALVMEALSQPVRRMTEIRHESLEEALFAHVAAGLRMLKPYRNLLVPVLETTLSPLNWSGNDASGLRTQHLERVTELCRQFGFETCITAAALQMYLALYFGVLAYWANDLSHKQETTLALLDQSMEMFVGWLRSSEKKAE